MGNTRDLQPRFRSMGGCLAVVCGVLAFGAPAQADVAFGVAWQVSHGDTCGAALAGLGDVNGDGYGDLLVGAPYAVGANPRPGHAYLYLGSPTGPAPTPTAEWQGSHNDALLGVAVAAAGDLDGDGFADWLIGAPGSAAGTVPGEVRVCYGGPAPTAAACRGLLTGAVAERFGEAVASAGDVNGDGFADVLVGAPASGSGATPGRGRVALFLGGPGGLAESPAWSVSGPTRDAACGKAVVGLGDVNGDGRGDVLVGAPGALLAGLPSGRVDLYLGTPAGLAPSPAWTVRGESPRGAFGAALALAGDTDRDGFADILIGAPNAAGTALDQGRAYLYRGGPRGFGASPAWSARGTGRGALFGFAMAGPGDVTGDGYPDVAIGAPGKATPVWDSAGAAYVFAGGPGGLGAAPVWTGDALAAESYYGYALAAAGDTDGDGRPELAVGAPNWPSDGGLVGRAFLIARAAVPFDAMADWQAFGEPTQENFGAALAAAGDVDRDGYADLLVGVRCALGTRECYGQVSLYRGGPDGPAPAPAWVHRSTQSFDDFGRSVAWAGDVNRDGYSDALLGAARDDEAADNGGRAELYLGSAQGLPASPDWVGYGLDLWGYYGVALAGAGDVNDDGYDDVVVAAPYVWDGNSAGCVSLYLGSSSGLSRYPDWVARGRPDDSAFGEGLAGAGDVNGDGFADVVVGAPDETVAGGRSGRAYLFFGGPTGLSADPVWNVAGPTYYAEFAATVAGVGDTNGDGFGDVVVGARQWNNGQYAEGAVLLYLGGPTGLGPEPTVVVESDSVSANFGSVVAAAGDVDGDGLADVLVGTPDLDAPDYGSGAVFLVPGAPGGLAASATWRCLGSHYYENWGAALSGGGDLDGDGTPDLAVGAPYYRHAMAMGRAVVFRSRCGRDTDGDGAGDCAEPCPADPQKTAPGACGCGRPDADSDLNGLADCLEPCLPHGDVNGDGLLTANDAQQAFAAALGMVVLDYRARCAADCTGNGALTAADAQALFAATLGSGTCAVPLGPWR